MLLEDGHAMPTIIQTIQALAAGHTCLCRGTATTRFDSVTFFVAAPDIIRADSIPDLCCLTVAKVFVASFC
jgi:hypothetical protein